MYDVKKMTAMPGRMQRISPTNVSTPMMSDARMTWPQLIPAKAVPDVDLLAAGQQQGGLDDARLDDQTEDDQAEDVEGDAEDRRAAEERRDPSVGVEGARR